MSTHGACIKETQSTFLVRNAWIINHCGEDRVVDAWWVRIRLYCLPPSGKKYESNQETNQGNNMMNQTVVVCVCVCVCIYQEIYLSCPV